LKWVSIADRKLLILQASGPEHILNPGDFIEIMYAIGPPFATPLVNFKTLGSTAKEIRIPKTNRRK
jgi:hypothetical protein